MSKVTETTLEIDLNALRQNYHFIKSKLKPSTKMLAVVKANGYGSDGVIIAKELSSLDCDYFAVAYAGEGVALRDAGIKTPILVLHPLPVNFDTIIDNKLEPSIYSLKMLRDFIAFADSKNQKNYPIHLKFNTGLNRLGFIASEIETMLQHIAETSSVKICSIFSHLAASEDANETIFTQNQIDQFQHISEEITTQIGYQPIRHTLNTSGILNFPEAQFDMVRCGIGIYGYGNDPKFDKELVPVLSLKTVISQIHHLREGDTIGYNRKGQATTALKTATLPIGHADGLPRSLGQGKASVFINGKAAPIIGNVCMDMIMVNITDIECNEGDEVIIFDKKHTAEMLAEQMNSISYELLTGLSSRIKRIIA
ncbi:putative bifunctional UDP-N-acetylmuramoyl-tripeptide:D-alanyl-D-alanine ligase/alanine racemase [unidentified eubacterium SCB49]|nr:putative bifunctional UDP-N-acetylmuramoyl-tripeptide:D-alanyl-D-alanine ligase/alanine racemase [unidentified eubacterium SCB49]